tara:strand:- start:561 stop:1391 length:831 start_codon:yes stop_codon:yes gene_type:complete
MCVISIIENKNMIPTFETSKLMNSSNPHGIGFCYYNKKYKCIYMKKGIGLKEINDLTQKAKYEGNLSMIQHYRIASVGDSSNKLLTHGFLIENMSKNELECYTNKDVFYHNGTLDMDILNEIATKILIKNEYSVYPSNKDNSEISDSQLMAWILNYVDYSILNMFTSQNKFCIMNGKNGKITKYGSWDKVKDDKQNLITSNNYFKQELYSLYQDEYSSLDYITKEEKNETDRILKKYKSIGLTKDELINEYLDYGTSVFDIEEQIENELAYGVHNE